MKGFLKPGEKSEYTPEQVAHFWEGVEYDPTYGKKGAPPKKNYVLSDGSLKSDYLVCSTYVNAAGTLWATGELATGQTSQGNLTKDSAYFQRGISRGHELAMGLIALGARRRKQLFCPRTSFREAFQRLDAGKSSFVVLAMYNSWQAESHHVAFLYWSTGQAQWMVSQANLKAKRVTNENLKAIKAQGADAMLEAIELTR